MCKNDLIWSTTILSISHKSCFFCQNGYQFERETILSVWYYPYFSLNHGAFRGWFHQPFFGENSPTACRVFFLVSKKRQKRGFAAHCENSMEFMMMFNPIQWWPFFFEMTKPSCPYSQKSNRHLRKNMHFFPEPSMLSESNHLTTGVKMFGVIIGFCPGGRGGNSANLPGRVPCLVP